MKKFYILTVVIALMLAFGTSGIVQPSMAQTAPKSPPAPLRPLDMSAFKEALSTLTPTRIAELDKIIFEASIADIQTALEAGDLDSQTLVTYYLYRIQQYDVDGLRAVIELNPNVLTEAHALDQERASGKVRGALHGIPVLLKDNISTAAPMHTTAGAAALMNNIADRDAFLVTQLRQAGAIILGKANLSEWAYWLDNSAPSGFSAVGGQVASPYGAGIDPLGSSTGSAVAVSANLVTIAIGTETAGSIIAPASLNGVVGIYPSRGLVSRDRIIPLTDQMDTAGPIARTVTDAAILLNVLRGVDANDPTTQEAGSLAATDFTTFLDANALQGKRIGLYVPDMTQAIWDDPAKLKALGIQNMLDTLDAAGAVVVPLLPQPSFPDLDWALIDAGFNFGFAQYMQAVNPDGDILNLQDVVTFNNGDPARYIPYGQGLLLEAADNTLTLENYLKRGPRRRKTAITALDRALTSDQLDAIVTYNYVLSWVYPPAGYPAITVPAGLDAGTPYGATFIGSYLHDGEIIGFAYAFEQAGKLRVIPAVGQAVQ